MRSQRRQNEVHIGVGTEPVMDASPIEDKPFCIAVLGDFSGRGGCGLGAGDQPLVERAVVSVDRDNFDAVMQQMAPALSGSHDTIRFNDLDDFHPDRLIQRLALFQSLRETRARVSDPAGFAAVKRELAAAEQSPAGHTSAPVIVPDNLLDQIVGENEGVVAEDASDLHSFIRRVVTPHLVPDVEPTQREMLNGIDLSITDHLRRILQHPDFKALEALWRGVFFLIRRLQTGSDLRVYLVDLSREELVADQDPQMPLQDTGLFKSLVESSIGTPGAVKWAAFAGAYEFGPSLDDAKLVARLATIAQLAGAPWISGALPAIVGCSSFGADVDPSNWTGDAGEAWAAVRLLPQASALGLAMPRFLLRLPYGSATDPCEEMEFEEFADDVVPHEGYLWGNPTFVCAYLLGKSYESAGWDLRPGMHLEVDRVPIHITKGKEGATAKPCAEALLTVRAAERIMEHGLMPLVWLKDTDTVRLARFQSVAEPPTALAGGWGM